ncbi:hypothetical protein AUP68_13890 [Ilyonectria robusta]
MSVSPAKDAPRIEGTVEINNEGPIPDNITTRWVAVSSATAKRAIYGAHPVKGLYWTKKDVDPSVVFMATHYTADFSEHYFAIPMALRGYGFLGWNTRFSSAEDKFVLSDALDDMAAGTAWLEKNTNVKKIIFIGNSGGGPLMAAFAAKVESDKSFAVRGPDGFVILNSHPGRADVMTTWLDPSVVDDNDPTNTDPSLDMYNPVNGPPYSPEFQARYRAAQIQRNHRITRWAKDELKRLNQAVTPDRIFNLFRNFADLRFLDGNIDPSEREIGKCFYGDPKNANRGVPLIARSSTIRTWLEMWSLEDSPSRFVKTAPNFKIPVLVLQTTGDISVFPYDARKLHELVASKDKELQFIPGAHFFEESQEELDGGADAIQTWTDKRFH